MNHLTMVELEAGLDEVRRSPQDDGELLLVVRRPGAGQREVLTEGRLDPSEGLVGDSWRSRGDPRAPDGKANPETQLTLMNARFIALIAGTKDRWPLAGDQLFVDLDLSLPNLPPGTRLTLGETILEVTAAPHTGCRQFVGWFGADAMQLANSPLGRNLNLRGIHARVIRAGKVSIGDRVGKLS